MCVCASPLCGHSRRTAGTGGIHSSAANGRTATCASGVGHPSFARVAEGVTWTSRTTSAPWAARSCHTSVIDAAGAIYVLGGYDGGNLQDVWVSTNGGADRSQSRVPEGALGGYHGGTGWVLWGYLRVPRVYTTQRSTEGYSRGT
jgi:hypothetical protein